MPKRSLPVRVSLALIFLSMTVSAGLAQTVIPPEPPKDPEEVRQLMLTLLTRVPQLYPVGPERARQFAQLREQIQNFTDAEVALMAQSVDRVSLRKSVGRIEKASARQPLKIALSPVQYDSTCGSTQSDPSTQKALLISAEVADGAAIIGDVACNSIVVILGEGTNLPACIIAGVLHGLSLALHSTYDQAAFCDGDIQGEIIQTMFTDVGIVHDDLGADTSAIKANSDANRDTIVANDNTAKDTFLAALTADTTSIRNDLSANTASIHSDLATATSTITTNSNTNKNAIVGNDNDNRDTILANLSTTGANIVNNDNLNRSMIIANASTNTATLTGAIASTEAAILANANAGAAMLGTRIDNVEATLKDLLLRTQIEADLAANDTAPPVALFETPSNLGGYLDLTRSIVVQTIANIASNKGGANAALARGDSYKVAGNFKAAYTAYRKAYKIAAQ
jgi:hypothetical protein